VAAVQGEVQWGTSCWDVELATRHWPWLCGTTTGNWEQPVTITGQIGWYIYTTLVYTAEARDLYCLVVAQGLYIHQLVAW
jgi:hypothetical protein